MLINPKPDYVQFSTPSLSKFMLINLKQLKNPVKLIKRKHPRKGEKNKQGARTEVQASKRPKRSRPQGRKGTTEYRNLHQLLEAYQVKKGEVNPIKLQA